MEKRKRREDEPAYLTKRLLVSLARKAGIEAQKKAMETMGYIVVAQEGWVVKIYADGKTEKIKPLATPANLEVIFD